jgi:plasmid replication initiation protein
MFAFGVERLSMLRFRIRHKQTDLYRTGNFSEKNQWSKAGKLWNSIGTLRAHLKMCIVYKLSDDFGNWIIEEVKIKEEITNTINPFDILS